MCKIAITECILGLLLNNKYKYYKFNYARTFLWTLLEIVTCLNAMLVTVVLYFRLYC